MAAAQAADPFAPRAEDPVRRRAASHVEGWLEHESRWWVMPYNFATPAEAADFMAEMQRRNPGRKFRLAAKA